MLVPVLGVMIPIVAIVMGIGIGMLGLWLNHRNKLKMFELHHVERMAAIEKGIELPPLPPEFFQDYRRGFSEPTRDLRTGLILLLVGFAIFGALYQVAGSDVAWWGLVPASIGAAYLLFYAFVGRKRAARNGGPPDGPAAAASARSGRSPPSL